MIAIINFRKAPDDNPLALSSEKIRKILESLLMESKIHQR